MFLVQVLSLCLRQLGGYERCEKEASGAEIEGGTQALGLADRLPIKTSYIAMLMAYFKERGQSPTEVTFAQAGAT